MLKKEILKKEEKKKKDDEPPLVEVEGGGGRGRGGTLACAAGPIKGRAGSSQVVCALSHERQYIRDLWREISSA